MGALEGLEENWLSRESHSCLKPCDAEPTSGDVPASGGPVEVEGLWEESALSDELTPFSAKEPECRRGERKVKKDSRTLLQRASRRVRGTHRSFGWQRCRCSEASPARLHRSSRRGPSPRRIPGGPRPSWVPGQRSWTRGCRPDPPPAPAPCGSGSWSLSDAGRCTSETWTGKRCEKRSYICFYVFIERICLVKTHRNRKLAKLILTKHGWTTRAGLLVA